MLAALAGCQADNATAPRLDATLHLTQGVGGVWTVNTLADPGDGVCDDTECTLREAIAAAAWGDKIVFATGLQGDIKLSGSWLRIEKSLTIDGAGRIAVDAQRGSGAMVVVALSGGTPVVTVARLTLKNGFNNGGLGGGFAAQDAKATLDSVTITNNEVTFNGGGVEVINSEVRIQNSTISYNSAGKFGGGIHLESGTVVVTATTISGNVAADGGGILVKTGTAAIARSTVSVNVATPGNTGLSGSGGIKNVGGVVALRSSTVTSNTGSYAGGLTNDGSLTMVNSIVAGNAGPARNDCVAGPDISLGHNILGDGCTAVPGDVKVTASQVFTLVLESTLKDNGGPTKTHALVARGLAVDAGVCPAETTDQRGFTRPVDDPTMPNAVDSCDIGAYEAQGPVIAKADLMVSQTVDKTSVKQGEQLTYTVRVQNVGPETAPNVVLSDVLSSGVTFVSARVNRGAITAPPAGETGTVTWNLGTMLTNANETAEVKVTVLVKGKTTITSTASVTGDVSDPNAANNSAAITVSVAAGSGGAGGKKQ